MYTVDSAYVAETSCNALLLIEVCNVPVEQEALKKAVHCGLSDCSLGYSKQEVGVCVCACVRACVHLETKETVQQYL